MRWQIVIAVAVIVLCASAAVAWISVGGPVAWRGEELRTITIHASGTLDEIAAQLLSQDALRIMAEGSGSVGKRQVSLDLQDATPTEVVTAICKHTGCVYEPWGPTAISPPPCHLAGGRLGR